MGEQCGPRQLVDDAVAAEAAGFDLLVASDHYYPWLDQQGHSPYPWSVLGAVAYVTRRIGLMSFVTCPIRRYQPAVVAHKAVPSARLWDLPDQRVPVVVAVSGPESIALAVSAADGMIATEPETGLVRFDQQGGTGSPRYGQVPLCFGPDEAESRKIAHQQFRWSGPLCLALLVLLAVFRDAAAGQDDGDLAR
jgi:alkanesulfonate monooxygenase SsuD/methylene tetrahydromethanopterin reductase-like flavin-dependent oxidoreductase (luciferase family)